MQVLRHNKPLSFLVLVFFLTLIMGNTVHAALVETQDLLQHSQINHDRQQLLQLLAQDEMRRQLQDLGVSPQQARQRVMAMTHEEVISLREQIEQAPAGSGVVGAIVFIFLVLLVTDILGITDVFPFVNKPRRR